MPARLAGADGASIAALHARPAGRTTTDSVVLVHGFTGSKEDFVDVLPLLSAAGLDAVAIDLPGQHESPATPLDPADPVASVARHIASVTRTLRDAGQRVHLVGHSFGGLATRRAVLDHDAEAASLTLLSSGPAALTDTTVRHSLQAFIDAMRAGLVDAVWAHMRAEKLASEPTPTPDVLAFLEHRLRSGAVHTHAAMAQGLLTEPDRTADLAAHPIRVSVAHGVDDDIWAPHVQQDMAERLGIHATAIDGAGHSPAVDAPESTVAVLLAAAQQPTGTR